MIVVRKSSLTILLMSALLLAAPALAEKVIPEEQGAAEKRAQGEGLPNPNPVLGPPPANDLCEDAETLAVPGTAIGNTDTAGIDEPPAFTCGTTITVGGVWYTVTGTGNTFTATTCNAGTDYDTKVSVFCEDCADLTCVDGNDDQPGPFDPACDVISNGFNRGSTVTFCTEPGATYSILVHGFDDSTGNFELSIDDDATPCAGGVMCLPTGACCDDMGGCAIETEVACLAGGGEYQGDGTECFTPSNDPTAYSATPGLPIPDNNPAGVDSIINVPDSFAIADVDVDLTVTHTWVGDLIVTLTHPSGTPTVTLWDRPCGDQDDMDVTVDDEAPDLVCASPVTGALNPLSAGGGALSAFDGLDAAGDWTLNISDNAGQDTGTLDAWALVLDVGEPTCRIDIVDIPILDQVGLAILALLIVGGAIFVLRRRL